MFQHILIATDGSGLAEEAAAQGLELARRLQARVTAVTASDPLVAIAAGDAALAFPSKAYDEDATRAAAAILARVADKARSAGVPCTLVHIKNTFPADGIVAAAREHGCDLIVMGSHGRRGVARLLLGSVASKVVVLSPVPVLICR